MRRDAALCCFLIERKDGVRRAAGLEGAPLLEVFALEKQRPAAGRIEARAGQHGRAMNMRANSIMGGPDGIESEHRQTPGRFSVPRRLPTVLRSCTGSSSAINFRKRSEKTGPRRLR